LYYNANVIIDHKSPQPKYDEAQGGKVVSITWEYQLANKRWESVTFNEAHFNKWRKASHVKNGRNKNDADLNKLNYANPNYTSFAGGIDPEFASAKCIKHALKKMALDRNRFEPQPIPVVTQHEAEHDDAGHNHAAQPAERPTMQMPNISLDLDDVDHVSPYQVRIDLADELWKLGQLHTSKALMEEVANEASGADKEKALKWLAERG
jgi:hypothetical protein